MKSNYALPLLLSTVLFALAACSDIDLPDAEPKTDDVEYASEPDLETLANGVRVKKIEDGYLMQGDIILTEKQFQILSSHNTRGASFTWIKTWPNRIVPYQIRSDVTNKNTIQQAIDHWNQKTVINLVPRTNQSAFVEFIPSPNTGNYSSVGMTGGKQHIQISKNAIPGSVMHEIGHAVGLIHEHCHPNRDEFLIIHPQNMVSGAETFDIDPLTWTIDDYVDFYSIMLYDPTMFSKGSGYPTMTMRYGGGTFTSNREKLSSTDIETVRRLYGQSPITQLQYVRMVAEKKNSQGLYNIYFKTDVDIHHRIRIRLKVDIYSSATKQGSPKLLINTKYYYWTFNVFNKQCPAMLIDLTPGQLEYHEYEWSIVDDGNRSWTDMRIVDIPAALNK